MVLWRLISGRHSQLFSLRATNFYEMSTEMEEDCEVFMDPEEDEIFFGQISDKEMTVSPIIKNSEPASHDNKADVNIENCNENDTKENNSDSLNKHDEIKENILKEKIMEQNINLIHEKNCLDDNLAQIEQKNLCENPAIKIEPCKYIFKI